MAHGLAHRGGADERTNELALWDGPVRHVEHGDQDGAVFGREGSERGGHRRRRLANLRVDHGVDLGRVGKCLTLELEAGADQPSDALRREVVVADDLPAVHLHEIDGI